MPTLSADHHAALDLAARQPMLDQTLRWAAINSGTGNLAGLAKVAGELADAFARLPGELNLLAADPVESILPDGRINSIERGRNLHLTVRPRSPRAAAVHRPHGHGVRRRPPLPGHRHAR